MSRGPIPNFIAPQLPRLSAEPPGGEGWIHEIKHDGFRTLLRIDRSDIRAFTRGGHDWSDKYGRVIEACRKLKCQSALIDGEIIVARTASPTLPPYEPPLRVLHIAWRCLPSICSSWTVRICAGCL